MCNYAAVQPLQCRFAYCRDEGLSCPLKTSGKSRRSLGSDTWWPPRFGGRGGGALYSGRYSPRVQLVDASACSEDSGSTARLESGAPYVQPIRALYASLPEAAADIVQLHRKQGCPPARIGTHLPGRCCELSLSCFIGAANAALLH